MFQISFKYIVVAGLFLCRFQAAQAQRFLSEYDSSLFLRDTLPEVAKRFKNLHFSGYIQPQYQVASRQGTESWAGGDFSEFSDNRFMLRRARLKVDYRLPVNGKPLPGALFTFQIDATERGVRVRDMFVKVYEPDKQFFSLTAGVFARPFGFEVNLSSSFRESPERARISQILMPSERGLGAMVSYESARAGRRKLQLKWDAGAFNGPGLSGEEEFDSFKDLISRITLRPFEVAHNLEISGGLSLLYGGWRQGADTRYQVQAQNGEKVFVATGDRAGSKVPRHYYGADVQVQKSYKKGKTELRAEYWRGKQPGTDLTTVNPGILPMGPTYVRNFDGGIFYFLQNIINEKWELLVKYDWYDPNTDVKETQIGKGGTNLTIADIKFATLGLGFTHYINNHLKVLVYYARVHNEATAMPNYSTDIKDNVLTCRLQMLF